MVRSIYYIKMVPSLQIPNTQVSSHVALDHQTYSTIAQHTQITWTAELKCDEPSRGWEGGGWVTLHINPTFIYGQLDQLAIKSPNTDFLKRT